ncbi:putative transmembrane domain protein, partial [Bacteroides fragilis str. 2-F-2 
MFLNNKSFGSKSFVLSIPKIKVFPTALTMLTQGSVPFLFDLRLI